MLTDIIVTHFRPNRFGYAGGLQVKHNIRVPMLKIDCDAALIVWNQEFLGKLSENYQLTDTQDDQANQMQKNTREFVPRVTPYPEVDHFFGMALSSQMAYMNLRLFQRRDIQVVGILNIYYIKVIVKEYSVMASIGTIHKD